MAGSYIEVNTGTLRKDTDDINEKVSRVASELEGMFDAVQTLNGMWQGPANTAFNEQFTIDHETMSDIINAMQNYIASLDDAGSEYEKCESSVGDVVASISI